MTSDETEVPKEPTAPDPTPAPASEAPAPPATPEAPPPAAVPMPPAAPPEPTPVDQFTKTMDQAGQQISKALSGGVDQNKFIFTAVISIFLPWVGAILNGQVAKGIFELIILLAASSIFFRILLLIGPIYGIVHLLFVIDSIVIASRINQGERFGDWDFCTKPKPGA